MLKLNFELAVVENEGDDNGFCYIKVNKDEGEVWLELLGNNDTKEEYPLCLGSESEIDDFAKKLKTLLKL